MNSFETDLKRAVFSYGFAAGLILELLILFTAGFDSDLFRMTVPILCTFPYTTAWLLDYQSGYIKSYLPRTSIKAYIMGKFLACGISGGMTETMGCFIFLMIQGKESTSVSLMLIFASGMLWAVLSATLAAISVSRYIAYGGAFVIYYLMVILHERYFDSLYCLYPYEWLAPEHTWIFGEQGVLLLTGGIILVLACIYYEVLRRYIDRV